MNFSLIRINLYISLRMKGQFYILSTLSITAPISPFTPRRRRP
jgi:hypothetical protein